MLKKAVSFLSKLNIFSVALFFVLFVVVRLDVLPEDIFAVWIYTMIISGAVGFLFLLSVCYLLFKSKKIPSSLEYIVSYFLSAVWICFVGCLAYDVFNFGVF